MDNADGVNGPNRKVLVYKLRGNILLPIHQNSNTRVELQDGNSKLSQPVGFFYG